MSKRKGSQEVTNEPEARKKKEEVRARLQSRSGRSTGKAEVVNADSPAQVVHEEEPLALEESEVFGEFNLDKRSAKQIAFCWRVILAELAAEGLYPGEVPSAFKASMGPDGSLFLEPYDMPDDVIILPEEGGMSLPSPIEHSLSRPAPQGGSPRVSGRSNERPVPPAQAGRSRRSRRSSRAGAAEGPPINTKGMRQIVSNDGDAEVR